MSRCAVTRGSAANSAPKDLPSWYWGAVNAVEIEHPVLGKIPLIRRWAAPGRAELTRRGADGWTRGEHRMDDATRALARGLDCSSPGSIMNPLNRTPAGDQYSLGCILYFCLAGQFPFPNPNPVKKMLGHECEEPAPLRQLNPQVTPRLAAIVQRLMAKKPEERYETIADVVRALQALTQSGPRRLPNQPTAPPTEAEIEDDEPRDPRSSWSVWPVLLTVLAAGIVGGAMTLLMTQR